MILADQNSCEQWYENIKASVSEHLWRYFDTETTLEYSEPIQHIHIVAIHYQLSSINKKFVIFNDHV